MFREILENAIAPKVKRLSATEHGELTTLLVQKDSELKETMKLAVEQGEIDKRMKLLQDEVDIQDNSIKQLQKQLKDAETVLVSTYNMQ
jgi:mediator of RNA polymerase II transcription subunit 4